MPTFTSSSAGSTASAQTEGNILVGKRWQAWLKRAGVVGFLLFLLKGLAWLAAGGAAAVGLL
jgi:hypothetical protein